MKQGMDDGSFLEQNEARFARVMSKVAPFFTQFSPALILSVAALSSGGALGAPGIGNAVLVEEAVKQVLVAPHRAISRQTHSQRVFDAHQR